MIKNTNLIPPPKPMQLSIGDYCLLRIPDGNKVHISKTYGRLYTDFKHTLCQLVGIVSPGKGLRKKAFGNLKGKKEAYKVRYVDFTTALELGLTRTNNDYCLISIDTATEYLVPYALQKNDLLSYYYSKHNINPSGIFTHIILDTIRYSENMKMLVADVINAQPDVHGASQRKTYYFDWLIDYYELMEE